MSRYQNTDERDIPRRDIHGAPYNPRKIGKDALRRLKENIRRAKLQGALVVNERTDANGWKPEECGIYLVSGHQRLSVLDALEKSDEYSVRCAVMRLDAKGEREQNLHFNAASAQGDFDVTLFKAMFEDPDVTLDVDAAGFDHLYLEDIGIMDGPVTEDDNTPAVQEMAATAEAIAQASRDAKAKTRAAARESDKGTDFTIVLVFPSSTRAQEVRQLMADAGYERAGEYFHGETIADALGLATKEKT